MDDAAPDPTGQTAPDGPTRPAPLVVAASIAALEGVELLLLAALEAASVDSERLSLGISTAVFFALTGAAVLGCAWGLLRLAGWSRGPLLLAQLIALGLAWNLKDAPLVALVLMPLVVMFGPGGTAGGSIEAVAASQPGFLSLTQGLTFLGFVSAVTWGLGYFGQPHIIVRFMAIDTVAKVRPARNIGMTWMGVALLGSIGIGIAGRAYAQRNGIVLDDPETIFIVLSDLLFHPLITGFLFAALLAAIMSTISSQLLVSSSSLTEDFYRLFLRKHASEREAVNVGRICVALVAVAAIFIARDPNSEVLGLVSNAWAGFGAAFGPLIILALTWDRMTGAGAVAGLLTGAAVVGIWIALGWNSDFINGQGLYEIVPGFIASWLAIVLVSKATEGHKAHA